MSADAIRPPRDVPPPGAPAHWEHMPWPARDRWIRRQIQAARAAQTQPGQGAPVARVSDLPRGGRPPREGQTPVWKQVLEYVLAVGDTITPRQVCGDLGKTPGAIAKALVRAQRGDLAGPYRRLDNAARKERGKTPEVVTPEVAARRDVIDRPLPIRHAVTDPGPP